ncbi:hypothetical protein GO755_34895 [Spirosoma sp. HMF4905]|uniref:Phage tail protein n=1 Tax=Spirosoma arboris TaxID=2682092 RepID=A0A7K1SN85_9BACT|nr:hypothetical protein [Spirosoma arboris]MVM35262.1 hypothetical protein [Spirosoma arboris]
MALITRGIVSIALGAINVDGGPGTTLATLGLTKKGTAKIQQDDGTTTDIMAEESDTPVESITTAGSTTFVWTILNPDIDTAIALFGGTATGTSPNRVWNMPASVVAIEQTVKITPTKGMSVIFPRAQVTVKLNGDFTKEDVFGFDVSIKALQPTKSGVGPVQFQQ